MVKGFLIGIDISYLRINLRYLAFFMIGIKLGEASRVTCLQVIFLLTSVQADDADRSGILF